MTTGQELKKKLGLLNFPYVKIRRVITGGSLRVYQICFDSRNPGRPLTSYLLKNSPLMPRITNGNIEKFYGTPWATLEIFNGDVMPAIFFTSDVAGFYGRPRNYSEKVFQISNNKLEELTIPELRAVDALTSDVTQKYKDIRRQFQGLANKNTKFLGVEFIKETGSIRFVFLTESTETKDKTKVSHTVGSEKKAQFDLTQDKLVQNASKTYDMYVQLENVVKNDFYTDISWLETYKGEIISQKMLKDLLEVADVKLFDNSPAFQFQGFRYRLTQQNSSIYPEDRPDTVWRSKHGTQGLLDKHFSQLLDKGSFDMFLNNMTSALFNKLKQLGYVDSKTKQVL